MNLPADPPEAYEDYFEQMQEVLETNRLNRKLSEIQFDETTDRLEELHRAIGLGVDFSEFSEADQKLLMNDVDVAMAEAQAEIAQENMIYKTHKNRYNLV